MRSVRVSTGNPYEVHIGRGLLGQAGARLLDALGKPCAVMLMADDRVDALYGGGAARSLAASGFVVERFSFAHGEENKNLGTWQAMLRALSERRLTRTDAVVALGGGVTGDMAGFAAAAYLRGIRFAQIPTTLLSMVDSSVGGKTGVNLPMGKNLAGAFHQPVLALCDPDALSTLPRETLLDGIAEVVKMAVLGDEAMFSWLEAGDCESRMEEMIHRCVEAKARLVAEDELDRGRRQLLNLGHTLGHAMERLSGYGMSHGRAVAVGMVYAAQIAWRMGLCGQDCTRRVRGTLQACGLPTSAPYGAAELLEAALSDKKRAGETLTLVLPTAIGACALHPIPVEEMGKLTRWAVED